MKLIVTLLLLISGFTVVAQKTKKVKSGSETYYVLQSDESIRHGEYYFKEWNLEIKGFFTNGSKSGEWEYLVDRELVHKYNWDSSKLVFGNEKPNDDGAISPFLLGGMARFYTSAGLLMRYPSEARRMGIEGRVYFEVTIDKDGKMVDPVIVSGIGYGCDEETIRVLKALDLDWIPARDANGEAVPVKMKMPMYFKLAN